MKRESAPQEYTCRNCPERYYHAIPAPPEVKGTHDALWRKLLHPAEESQAS